MLGRSAARPLGRSQGARDPRAAPRAQRPAPLGEAFAVRSWRSSAARSAEPHPSARALVGLRGQAGDAFALASRDRQAPLGLRETSSRAASARRAVPRPDPAPRAREPALGSPTDRRRAQEARAVGVRDLGTQPLAAPRRAASATPPLVARIPASASGKFGRLRLLHRRDGVPAADLRPVLHRAAKPARASRRLDWQPRRRLGRPAGSQPDDDPRGARATSALLIHDRDAKFSAAFDEVFRSEGARVIRTPIQAPNANAHAERWVRTVRSECLDWLLIFGRRQLERVLRTYVDHYNRRRPHRALDLDAPDPISKLVPLPEARPRTVHRRDRLGGLLHEYELAA
jgi:hypothetical protein